MSAGEALGGDGETTSTNSYLSGPRLRRIAIVGPNILRPLPISGTKIRLLKKMTHLHPLSVRRQARWPASSGTCAPSRSSPQVYNADVDENWSVQTNIREN